MEKTLFETKNKKKNIVLVDVIKSGLKDLKEEIANMSEKEKKLKKTNEILKIVKEILGFNKKI